MASQWRHRVPGLFLAGLAALGLATCGKSSPPRGGGAPDAGGAGSATPMRIVVTIPPLEWAVRGLAPKDARITLLVPPGASAHGYELTPAQAAAIAGADLVVMVGFDMEPRVDAALDAHGNKSRRVVRFEDVVGDDIIEDGDDHDHDDHAHGGDEHHPGADPHAWLDPVLMGRFVEMLGEEMSALPGAEPRPDLRAKLAASLQAQCAAVDAGYRAALERASTKSIVTHHNAYAYLAYRYGLTVAAVIQGGGVGGGGSSGHGGEPTPGDIAEAVRAVRASGVKAVFVEPQMNDASARRVAEAAGVKVLTLDPLGDGDWPEMMRKNLEALVEGLGGAGGSPAAGG